MNPAAIRARLRHPTSFLSLARERTIEGALMLCGAISIVAISLIFIFLFKEGLQALGSIHLGDLYQAKTVAQKYDAATETTIDLPPQYTFTWQPVSEKPKFSFVPLILGSIGVAGISAILSTLAGLGIGIYLSEIASERMRSIIKPAMELLVGIPTIVVGFFMLAVVAQPTFELFQSLGMAKVYNDTYNMFIGALGVSVVIIPVTASLVDDALRAIPMELRAGSLSLGATRWQTTWRVVLPAAVSGVLAAVILGFGRALGETMIVLMCAGNAPNITVNPFDAVRTMTATIAVEMGAAAQGGTHAQVLFLLGALLVTLSFVLNLIVETIAARFRRRIRL